MCLTYALEINENLDMKNFNQLLLYVSEEKINRIYRFHRFEDAQRSLLGDILARYVICKNMKIKNKEIVFKTSEYGKPFLSGQSNIHFNISHCENWVVCSLDNSSVGVDVETIKPIDLNIAERFFSKDENDYILSQSADKQLTNFFKVWTLKESYIKNIGEGLSRLNSFSFNFFPKISLVKPYTDSQEFFFHQFFLDNNSIISICALSDQFYEGDTFNVGSFVNSVKDLL